ncbi:hypothetical protein TNCV_4429501 [Trichonephila clavipes]|nr:hypothetical protein TNCV_4429501 [Trichonephila clavipes]
MTDLTRIILSTRRVFGSIRTQPITGQLQPRANEATAATCGDSKFYHLRARKMTTLRLPLLVFRMLFSLHPPRKRSLYATGQNQLAVREPLFSKTQRSLEDANEAPVTPKGCWRTDESLTVKSMSAVTRHASEDAWNAHFSGARDGTRHARSSPKRVVLSEDGKK